MSELSERSAGPDDFSSQALWRRSRALLLSRRGRHQEAEALAREAVRITNATDYLQEIADGRMALAEVLEVAGRPAEAADEVRLAAELYRTRGATVLLDRALAELARLGPTAE